MLAMMNISVILVLMTDTTIHWAKWVKDICKSIKSKYDKKRASSGYGFWDYFGDDGSIIGGSLLVILVIILVVAVIKNNKDLRRKEKETQEQIAFVADIRSKRIAQQKEMMGHGYAQYFTCKECGEQFEYRCKKSEIKGDTDE